MHWFHHVGEMGWLVIFWVASFLALLGASWLLTLKRPPRQPSHSPLLPRPRPSA